jgi:hypothetical protein
LIFVSGQGPFDPVSGTIVDVPGLRLSISAIAEA